MNVRITESLKRQIRDCMRVYDFNVEADFVRKALAEGVNLLFTKHHERYERTENLCLPGEGTSEAFQSQGQQNQGGAEHERDRRTDEGNISADEKDERQSNSSFPGESLTSPTDFAQKLEALKNPSLEGVTLRKEAMQEEEVQS
jgi:hypothetical protein